MAKKLLITLLALAGLAGITMGIGLFLLNQDSFLKGQLHRVLFNTTGWSIIVDGPLDLDLGKEITLQATALTLSQPAWGSQPVLAKAGRLEITIDSGVLLGKKLVIQSVELENCTVNLSRNEQDESNWTITAATDESEALEEPQSGLKEPPLKLNHVSVKNCQIIHTTPERERPLEAVITALTMSLQDDGKYHETLTGFVDDVPLQLNGTAGPMRALWQGGRFDHDIKLQIGRIRLDSSGTVADVKTLSGADLAMTFSGPEIGFVIRDLALPPFSSGAFDFSLDLDTTGAMTAIDIKGNLGSLEATVNGQLDRLLHPTRGNLNLTATGPNLGALAEALGLAGLIPDPFDVELTGSVKDGRTQLERLVLKTEKDRVEVIGVIGVYPGLTGTELNIVAHSDEGDRWMPALGMERRPIGVLDTTLRLTTDQAGLVKLEGNLDQDRNHLDLSGTLGRFPAMDRPDFTFSIAIPDLQSVGARWELQTLPAAPLKLNGEISKEGSTMQLENILADLDGNRFMANGEVILDDSLLGSRIEVESDIPSASKFAALFGVDDIPDQSLTLKTVIQPVGDGMTFNVTDGQLGDIKINLDGAIADLDHPALLNADFGISLPSLTLLNFLVPDSTLPKLPFEARGQIRNRDGLVELKSAHLALGSTTATLEGQIYSAGNGVGFNLAWSATGQDLRELIDLPQLDSLPHDFSGSGNWARSNEGDQLDGIEIRLGGMVLKLEGHADNLQQLNRFSLQTRLSVADMSVFEKLLQRHIEPDRLTLSASVEGNKHTFDVRKLAIKLGNSDLGGNIHVDRSAKPRLSGEVTSKLIDLRQLQQNIVDAGSTPGRAADGPVAEASIPDSAARVFTDRPIKALQESPVDLDLDIQIGQVELINTTIDNIDLKVFWENSVLEISPFQLSDHKGAQLDGNLSIDGRDGKPKLSFKLNGKDLRLGITSVKGQDPDTYPPVEMHIDLVGSGQTHHELAKSLDGTIRIFWGSGLYAASGFGFIFSDFLTELLAMLNPFSGTNDYASLECGVLAADIQSGIITIEPILLQDKKITIVSKGTIDLDTEILNLTFNTKPRKGFGVSAGVIINSLIKVGGTLKTPGIEFDAGSAVVSGGTAVATVGLSLLAKSFADRFLSSKDPCGDARKKLAEKYSQSEP